MVRIPRIYLAGPDVFRPHAQVYAQLLQSLCIEHGLDGVFPTDDPLAFGLRSVSAYGEICRMAGRDEPTMAEFIRAKCIQHLRECDGVVANITPFRGINADDGTALEIGFMEALGKPCRAYSSMAQTTYLSRYKRSTVKDDWAVEDYKLTANLMLVAGVKVYDGPIGAVASMAAHFITKEDEHEKVSNGNNNISNPRTRSFSIVPKG